VHGVALALLLGLLEFGIEHSLQAESGRQHAQALVGLRDVFPARRVHVPDLHHLGQNQLAHGLGLVQQLLAGFRGGIARQDQVRDLFGVGHGVAPAIVHGAQEGFDPVRVCGYFGLGRGEAVPVEVHGVMVGVEDARRDPALLHEKGLVGEIGGHGVHRAVHQGVDAPCVRHRGVVLGEDAFVGQHGVAFGVCGLGEHDPLAHQGLRRGEAAVAPGHDDVGRVLEYGRQGHHLPAFLALEDDGCGIHRVVGLPGEEAL